LTDHALLLDTLEALRCDYALLERPFADWIVPSQCARAVVVGRIMFGFRVSGCYLGHTEDDGIWVSKMRRKRNASNS